MTESLLQSEDQANKSPVVLGIGNILLQDEGVGIHVVHELQKRYTLSEDVEVLDGGTAGIELLAYISNRECLIIIDAMKSDEPPGAIKRFEGDEVPAAFRTRISPHQLGLSDLLAAAMLTDEMPKKIILLGIEPESVDMGLQLTEPVAARFDDLLNMVAEELKEAGCKVNKKGFSQGFTIDAEDIPFWEKNIK